jgi:8-oxo-dGTP pyrophosphatase MutT (NUDIX family)
VTEWETLKREEILDCSPWFRVYQEAVRLEDGQTVVPDFYLIDATSYVMVFALTEDGKVPVVEQYKHALKRRVLALPAGYIDPGEEPAVSAKRELLEETGMESPAWRSLGAFVTDGNRGAGLCHAYLALQAVQVKEPDPGDLQELTLHLYTLERLRAEWQSGVFPGLASLGVIGLGLAYVGTDAFIVGGRRHDE